MRICESDHSVLQKVNNYHSISPFTFTIKLPVVCISLQLNFLLDLSESVFHPHLYTEPSLSKVTNEIFLYGGTTPMDSIKPSTPWRTPVLCSFGPLFSRCFSSLLLFVSLLLSPSTPVPFSYSLLTPNHPHNETGTTGDGRVASKWCVPWLCQRKHDGVVGAQALGLKNLDSVTD